MSSETAKLLTNSLLTVPRYAYKGIGLPCLLTQRRKGLLIIGHIFKSAVPDGSDEDRRELERYA